MPKGTKVMRDTSWVMTMLNTKGSSTSRISSCREVWMYPRNRVPKKSNSPSRWKPVITAIRLNSSARVSQSI